MEPKSNQLKTIPIHYVSSTESTEFTQLSFALKHSSVIGLDAEWKPIRTKPSSFPTVSLLQLACRVKRTDSNSVEKKNGETELVVFLVDLLEIDVSSIWRNLKEMFVSSDILKLGFRFKQDLAYLSSTFCSHGCDPGFDKVEPFIDIANVYRHLQPKRLGRKLSKDQKGLAAICEEVLGVTLSKELQCSDWSCRPLTEEQQTYAAADAQCLVEIFDIFHGKVLKEGISLQSCTVLHPSNVVLGLKEVYRNSDVCNNVFRQKCLQTSDVVGSANVSGIIYKTCTTVGSLSSFLCNNSAMDGSLSEIVRMYGEKLLLKESDRYPKTSKKKTNKQPSVGLVSKIKQIESCVDYQGPPPWDLSVGGDGCPKFLCDVMVEGLAKHLRGVGIDAAIPDSRKPDTRQLIDHAQKEKRILLTRDSKILRHEYLIPNQLYRVNSLLKNDQLLEVIQKFKLKICEDQLMSRCTKCNGMFIQKPLTTDEAIEAAKGFQKIPSCLFNRNIEFWQCMDCKQLYWEGTQYHNAIEKFIDICQLNK